MSTRVAFACSIAAAETLVRALDVRVLMTSDAAVSADDVATVESLRRDLLYAIERAKRNAMFDPETDDGLIILSDSYSRARLFLMTTVAAVDASRRYVIVTNDSDLNKLHGLAPARWPFIMLDSINRWPETLHYLIQRGHPQRVHY